MNAPRPRPAVTGLAAPFWQSLADGQLQLARCATCHAYRHPPRPVCDRCGGDHFEWVPSLGTGEVSSFTVVHRPTLPAFADEVPYGAVVVRLDEDVFMVSQLVDCPIDALAVGMRVEVAPTECDGVVLPLFRRVDNAARPTTIGP